VGGLRTARAARDAPDRQPALGDVAADAIAAFLAKDDHENGCIVRWVGASPKFVSSDKDVKTALNVLPVRAGTI